MVVALRLRLPLAPCRRQAQPPRRRAPLCAAARAEPRGALPPRLAPLAAAPPQPPPPPRGALAQLGHEPWTPRGAAAAARRPAVAVPRGRRRDAARLRQDGSRPADRQRRLRQSLPRHVRRRGSRRQGDAPPARARAGDEARGAAHAHVHLGAHRLLPRRLPRARRARPPFAVAGDGAVRARQRARRDGAPPRPARRGGSARRRQLRAARARAHPHGAARVPPRREGR
mmetsp:Transcript_32824/g.81720  ORF Transcript_32824/g.81720 Transcript_32824/m.81720 type:complete len:228 (-) Transcript_32824:544-1227(-)